MTDAYTQKTLADLACDVAKATTALADAERETSFARSRETSARNDLNAAQRAFDAAVAEVRKAAPRDSDWARCQSKPVIEIVRGAVG